jgi:nitrile hydratase accessory protein
MSGASPERLLDGSGPAAPPRNNGELVFRAPWESRVFGLTLALFEQGRFEWDEFRQRLIASIARAERSLGPDDAYEYYACWLEALQSLLAAKGLCASEALVERVGALAARPPGHDHGSG